MQSIWFILVCGFMEKNDPYDIIVVRYNQKLLVVSRSLLLLFLLLTGSHNLQYYAIICPVDI